MTPPFSHESALLIALEQYLSVELGLSFVTPIQLDGEPHMIAGRIWFPETQFTPERFDIGNRTVGVFISLVVGVVKTSSASVFASAKYLALDYQAALTESMRFLRLNGYSGTFRGHQLSRAFYGIQPVISKIRLRQNTEPPAIGSEYYEVFVDQVWRLMLDDAVLI